ncbi:MAG: CoA transferase [Salinisphaeraceae bacterium]|nr:CoA transferase [Salinisphaeraceae bacterium]
MSKPLEGLRILSLAEQYPGPYATLLLADLGADVILVERPSGGDPARGFPEFFAALNRNKRSICLDLKSDAGRDSLCRLACDADVLLEGYRPGVMRRLGLDYESLAANNPRLVYVSITGFGQDGPYRDRPAHDLSYQAMAGLLFRQADSPGVVPDLTIGDLSSAMFATVAVLAALQQRQRTGRGTYVDVSMTDGLVSWMGTQLGAVLNDGPLFEPDREPAYGVYRCSDDRCLSLSIAHEDGFWTRLCEVLELPDIAALKHAERITRTAELREQLAACLARRPRAHWAKILDEQDIPWGAVNSLSEVTGDKHFRARGLFTELDGRHFVNQPLKFAGMSASINRPSPGLGEHTAEVLGK